MLQLLQTPSMNGNGEAEKSMLQLFQAPLMNGDGETEKVIRVPRKRIRPFPDQPRKFFDQSKLRELAESIKVVGQIVPASVKVLEPPNPDFDYELVDGQRRWHACDIANVELMKVIVISVKDATEQFLISVVSNFGRADHTPLETANAVKFFRDKGMTGDQIAQIFARSTAWVYQHLKILQLDTTVLAMMSPELPEEKQLGLSAALLIADVPQNLQKKIADTIIDQRMKVNQARNFIRQRAEKMGFRVGDPTRVPSDDYRVFRSFIGRLRRELDMFLEMPQSFFDKMFQYREVDDYDAVINRVEDNINELQALLQALQRAKK
jgi:ParB/RepB/Spo0J family partition protein